MKLSEWPVVGEVETLIIIRSPTYSCPKHGNIGEQIINCSIPGHEGNWCQRCWAESLDAAGVHRVTPEQSN
jgi:hypothetical protein